MISEHTLMHSLHVFASGLRIAVFSVNSSVFSCFLRGNILLHGICLRCLCACFLLKLGCVSEFYATSSGMSMLCFYVYLFMLLSSRLSSCVLDASLNFGSGVGGWGVNDVRPPMCNVLGFFYIMRLNAPSSRCFLDYVKNIYHGLLLSLVQDFSLLAGSMAALSGCGAVCRVYILLLCFPASKMLSVSAAVPKRRF